MLETYQSRVYQLNESRIVDLSAITDHAVDTKDIKFTPQPYNEDQITFNINHKVKQMEGEVCSKRPI